MQTGIGIGVSTAFGATTARSVIPGVSDLLSDPDDLLYHWGLRAESTAQAVGVSDLLSDPDDLLYHWA